MRANHLQPGCDYPADTRRRALDAIGSRAAVLAIPRLCAGAGDRREIAKFALLDDRLLRDIGSPAAGGVFDQQAVLGGRMDGILRARDTERTPGAKTDSRASHRHSPRLLPQSSNG